MPMTDPSESGRARGNGQPTLALPAPVAVGVGRTAVRLEPVSQGRDFLILITGGEAHVGAAAVCDGRAAPAESGPETGLVQVPGHREGPLAAEAAVTLARATGRTCAAVVGIHQDNATSDEIREIVGNVREGLRRLATAFAEMGQP